MQFAAEQKSLTGWIARFRSMLAGYTMAPGASEPGYLSGRKAVPFEALLFPIVDQSLGRLRQECPPGVVSHSAIMDSGYYLLTELARVSSPSLYQAFDQFRKNQITDHDGRTGDSLYREFIRSFCAGGLCLFFTTYSVLARQLVALADQWVQGTALFFKRFAEDQQMLYGIFFGGKSPGELVQIRSGVTARHTADGEVSILTFSSGKRLVYKPRSAGTDKALRTIVDWLNATGALLKMRPATVLDRGLYSWHAYVPYNACKTEKEVKDFYTRIGQLGGLLQILGSSDYHFDNLRADGPYPILLDNETLFSPVLRGGETLPVSTGWNNEGGILRKLSKSLFFIDSRELGDPTNPSISGVFQNKSRHRVVRFSLVNTDRMRITRGYLSITGKNHPKVNGKKVGPRNYQNEILLGYRAVLNVICAATDTFANMVKAATDNFNIEIRLLIRPSAYYEQMLYALAQPQQMTDGMARSLYLEHLALFYLSENRPKEAAALLHEEQCMLDQYLLPWFHLHAHDQPGPGARSIIDSSAEVVFNETIEQLSPQYQSASLRVLRAFLSRKTMP
jgi:lantibiotic modifying enzyme